MFKISSRQGVMRAPCNALLSVSASAVVLIGHGVFVPAVLAQAPILFELDLESINDLGLPRPEELSKLPAVQRDLALVVKQCVSAQSLLDAMTSSRTQFVRAIELFDEFKPKAGSSSMADDEKSLAFRVTLLNPLETLQDSQIDAVMAQLLGAVEKNCAARLR